MRRLSDLWAEQSTPVKLAAIIGMVGVVILVGGPAFVSAITGALNFGADTAPEPPAADFGMSYAADGRAVTLQHEAGDPVNASRVHVEIGDNRSVDWTAEDGTISPGDTVLVERVDKHVDVRVVWTGNGNQTVLAEFTTDRR